MAWSMTLEVMRMSSTPYRLAVVALLGWSPVAVAQAPAVRVSREQQLVLSQRPARAELEVRVGEGVTTLVRVAAEVVEVKREALGGSVWVDVAASSVLLEPLRELAEGERLPLELVLQEGGVRTRLVLWLVSRPGEVDTRVGVELRLRSARRERALEVARPREEEELLARRALAGVRGEKGVKVGPFDGVARGEVVFVRRLWDSRTTQGRAIVFKLFNPSGARPWMASEAVRLSREGAVLPGARPWAVYMEAPIAPGSWGLVVVLVPPEEADAPVWLEVHELGGSRDVRLKEKR
jgi:uncharacterized protein (TIGR02268 family)